MLSYHVLRYLIGPCLAVCHVIELRQCQAGKCAPPAASMATARLDVTPRMAFRIRADRIIYFASRCTNCGRVQAWIAVSLK
jgi:hypothetical protein